MTMHEAGHPKSGLWDNPEGWGGDAGGMTPRGMMVGTHVCLWLIHVDVWQKPSYCCTVIILQLK